MWPGGMTFVVIGSLFFFNVPNCWRNSYDKFGGATRRRFFSLSAKKPEGAENRPPTSLCVAFRVGTAHFPTWHLAAGSSTSLVWRVLTRRAARPCPTSLLTAWIESVISILYSRCVIYSILRNVLSLNLNQSVLISRFPRSIKYGTVPPIAIIWWEVRAGGSVTSNVVLFLNKVVTEKCTLTTLVLMHFPTYDAVKLSWWFDAHLRFPAKMNRWSWRSIRYGLNSGVNGFVSWQATRWFLNRSVNSLRSQTRGGSYPPCREGWRNGECRRGLHYSPSDMQDIDFSWQAMQEVVMSGSNYTDFVDSLSKYNRVCCNGTAYREYNYCKLLLKIFITIIMSWTMQFPFVHAKM